MIQGSIQAHVMLALIDCNNFFVSCERLFAPHLHGRPVVVLSNNDACVISRSNEAKALGIPMGEPAFRLRERERRGEVVLRSADFALYADLSRRVMAVLRQASPQVEVHSVDEAFLHLADAAAAAAIRAQVQRWCGLPIAVGLAPSRLLAKLAADLAKKHDGVLLLEPDAAELTAVPVQEVCGIGARLGAALRQEKILTAADLRDADRAGLRRRHGIGMVRLHDGLRGDPGPVLGCPRQPPQSVMVSRSFPVATADPALVRTALVRFAIKAAGRLRQQGQAAGRLDVFLILGQNHAEARTMTFSARLDPASDRDAELAAAAQGLGAGLPPPGVLCRKVGVVCTALVPAAERQQRWFDADDGRPRLLQAAIDRINTRHGGDAVVANAWAAAPQRLGPPRRWRGWTTLESLRVRNATNQVKFRQETSRRILDPKGLGS